MKLSLFVLAALAMSRTASADIAQIKSLNVDPSCGSVQTDITETVGSACGLRSITGESLRVFFDNFHIQAQQPGVVKKSCKVEAVLTIPGGYRILPLGVDAEGSYNIQPEDSSNASLTLTHMVMPTNRYARSSNSKAPWTGTGDFSSRTAHAGKEYIGCSNREFTVTLTTYLDFRLAQGRGAQTSIEVDALRNDYLVELCGSYFDGKVFRAYMKFGSSNTMPVRFEPYGDKGRLTGDNGAQGVLSSVQYGDAGKKISGIFDYAGRRGQFSATIVNTETGEFRGTLTNRDGTPGVFFGSYLE